MTKYEEIAEYSISHHKDVLVRCLGALFSQNDPEKILEIVAALRWSAFEIHRIADCLWSEANFNSI